jgi:hypothetical protein
MHILWSMKIAKINIFRVEWDNYFRTITTLEIMLYVCEQTSLKERIVLPKIRPGIGISNTWNDNGLILSDGDVFNLVIHYWWDRFFHFCKI